MSVRILLNKLSEVVESNLQNEQFGVHELASSLGMSRSNLHRKLQKATAQSVSQFIREYRLTKAKEILRMEEVTVSEVAYRVGFNSLSYFSKSFSDYFGYSPLKVKSGTEVLPTPTLVRNRRRWKKLYSYSFLAILFLFGCFSTIHYHITNTSNNIHIATPDNNMTIAVLPFKNLSAEMNSQYFTDAVMGTLLNRLSRSKMLTITSRTSVEQFRNTIKSVPEIGQELKVDYIIEGSVQKYGEEVEVSARLIDVRSDAQVWSQNHTHIFKEILSLQVEIADEMACELLASTFLPKKDLNNVIRLPQRINLLSD